MNKYILSKYGHMTKAEAVKNLAAIREKLENPPRTLIPAAIPVMEETAKELEIYIEEKEENA